jgi:hypothetical protein
MPSLYDHPGYLGWTSQGVIAIHADWPAYAIEHGIRYSLMSLGQFPQGTRFTKLDDIDRCFLFLVGDRPGVGDPFDESHFHLALWHEDVLALSNAGYVTGATTIPHKEWEKRRAEELKGVMWQKPDGTFVPLPAPEPDEREEWEDPRVVVITEELVMTAAGRAALESLLVGERQKIDESLMQRAHHAIQANLYDSAIREACVVVETAMRECVGTRAYGAKLIDEFFDRALSKNLIPAVLKTFRTEVRTAFRFVRNDYAHNLRTIDQQQCFAILARMSNVYVGVKQIAGAIRKNG